MKQLFLLFSLCFINSVFAQNWVQMDLTNNSYLNKIHIANNGSAYVVGLQPSVLLKLNNSNKSWSAVSIPDSFDIADVCFINDNTGFISGSKGPGTPEGKIYKTTNAGADWTDISPLNTFGLNLIKFQDDMKGVAHSSYTSRTYFTEDGGQNWTEDTLWGFSKDLYAFNDTIIVSSTYVSFVPETVNGTRLYTSYDAGKTWKEKYFNDGSTEILSMQFLTSLKGFILMRKSSAKILYKTEDGGETFDSVLISQAVSDFSFTTENFGYFIEGKNIYQSENAGETLTLMQTAQEFLYDINSSYQLISGNNGTILTTAVSIGMKEELKDEINIFPNPLKSGFDLTISGINSNGILKIYNSFGQEIYYNNFSGAITIQQNLIPGIYFVEVESADVHLYRKLIIH